MVKVIYDPHVEISRQYTVEEPTWNINVQPRVEYGRGPTKVVPIKCSQEEVEHLVDGYLKKIYPRSHITVNHYDDTRASDTPPTSTSSFQRLKSTLTLTLRPIAPSCKKHAAMAATMTTTNLMSVARSALYLCKNMSQKLPNSTAKYLNFAVVKNVPDAIHRYLYSASTTRRLLNTLSTKLRFRRHSVTFVPTDEVHTTEANEDSGEVPGIMNDRTNESHVDINPDIYPSPANVSNDPSLYLSDVDNPENTEQEPMAVGVDLGIEDNLYREHRRSSFSVEGSNEYLDNEENLKAKYMIQSKKGSRKKWAFTNFASVINRDVHMQEVFDKLPPQGCVSWCVILEHLTKGGEEDVTSLNQARLDCAIIRNLDIPAFVKFGRQVTPEIEVFRAFPISNNVAEKLDNPVFTQNVSKMLSDSRWHTTAVHLLTRKIVNANVRCSTWFPRLDPFLVDTTRTINKSITESLQMFFLHDCAFSHEPRDIVSLYLKYTSSMQKCYRGHGSLVSVLSRVLSVGSMHRWRIACVLARNI